MFFFRPVFLTRHQGFIVVNIVKLMISDEKLSISEKCVLDLGNAPHKADDLPLALFAQVDRFGAELGSREWRLTAQRQQGRSHVLVLDHGKGVARLTQGQVTLRAPCLVWLPPGAGQVIQIAPGSEGFVLSLAEDLVAKAADRHRASGELRSVADRLVHAEGERLGPCITKLTQAADAIQSELRAPGEGGLHLIIAHVTVILVHAWRFAGFQIPNGEETWSGSPILQRFLHAVELHFRENWPISQFASQLGVTERRLHASVSKATGNSPLQLLHLRILQEARSRLEQSALPIAQIGYGLGFRDPAHFSRFFKKSIGLSPGAFRRRRRQDARRDTTFAAWP